MSFPGFKSLNICPWCCYAPSDEGRDYFSTGEYNPTIGRWHCPSCGVLWEERYTQGKRKYEYGDCIATRLVGLPPGIDPRDFDYAEWLQRMKAARLRDSQLTPT